MKLYEYVIKVKDLASDKVKSVARQFGVADSNIKRASRSMTESETKAKKLGSTFSGLRGMIAGAFALTAVTAFAGGIVKLGAQMEQTRVSMTTFLGDSEKANQSINQLTAFANATPFDTNQVLRAGKGLLAFGVTADDLVPTLTKIGDISAGTGKNFNELATIFGKAKIAGTLYAEDINQLVEAGIPVMEEFAKALGTTEDQVKKMASEGKLKFKDLENAFTNLTAEGAMFGGLMEKQAETLGGKWSTLIGKAQLMGARIGEALIPILKPLVDMGIALLDNSEALETLAYIAGIATAAFLAYQTVVYGAALGTFLYSKATALARIATLIFTGNFAALNAVMTANPIGLVIAALVALAGTVVYLYNKFDWFKGGVWGLWESMKEVFMSIADLAKNIFGGLWDIISGLWNQDFDKAKAGLSKLGKGLLATTPGGFASQYGEKIADKFTEGYKNGLKKENIGVSSLLGGGDTAGSSSFATPAAPDNQQTSSGIDSIASGGGGVNISFGDIHLAEDIIMNVQNATEGAEELKEIFKRMLADVLNGAVRTARGANG